MLHSRGHLLAYNAYPAKLRRSCNLQLNASPMLSQWALGRVWPEKLPRQRAANVSMHYQGDGPRNDCHGNSLMPCNFEQHATLPSKGLTWGREGQAQARQRQLYERNNGHGVTVVGCRDRVQCIVRATMQFSHGT